MDNFNIENTKTNGKKTDIINDNKNSLVKFLSKKGDFYKKDTTHKSNLKLVDLKNDIFKNFKLSGTQKTDSDFNLNLKHKKQENYLNTAEIGYEHTESLGDFLTISDTYILGNKGLRLDVKVGNKIKSFSFTGVIRNKGQLYKITAGTLQKKIKNGLDINTIFTGITTDKDFVNAKGELYATLGVKATYTKSGKDVLLLDGDMYKFNGEDRFELGIKGDYIFDSKNKIQSNIDLNNKLKKLDGDLIYSHRFNNKTQFSSKLIYNNLDENKISGDLKLGYDIYNFGIGYDGNGNTKLKAGFKIALGKTKTPKFKDYTRKVEDKSDVDYYDMGAILTGKTLGKTDVTEKKDLTDENLVYEVNDKLLSTGRLQLLSVGSYNAEILIPTFSRGEKNIILKNNDTGEKSKIKTPASDRLILNNINPDTNYSIELSVLDGKNTILFNEKIEFITGHKLEEL